MSKNTGSCFEMFCKDLENILGLVILAFYYILSGIVMKLNLFNTYFDDLRCLQMEHISSSPCKVSFRSLFEKPQFSNFAICDLFLRVRKTSILGALQLLF